MNTNFGGAGDYKTIFFPNLENREAEIHLELVMPQK